MSRTSQLLYCCLLAPAAAVLALLRTWDAQSCHCGKDRESEHLLDQLIELGNGLLHGMA